MKEQGIEISLILDPFWLEHGEEIRQATEAIGFPKTRVGEEEWGNALNNSIFQVYQRLYHIYGSLLALVEYDEVAKREKLDFFSDPANQRIVLKAMGLLIEDEIKDYYPTHEEKKYKDYRRFFEVMLNELKVFDSLIQAGVKFPSFVDSLIIRFNHGVNEGFKRGENLSLETSEIRKKIADYLPQLEEIEEGEVLGAIKDQLPLSENEPNPH